MEIQSHKDLIVWQKSIDLVLAIYEVTSNFPSDERYGLISQLRRAAVSIPSNIAEGHARGTRKDYAQFLRIALGSASELETQILISKRLPLSRGIDFSSIEDLLPQVGKMLRAIIQKLSLTPRT